jgi:hypothetical protein
MVCEPLKAVFGKDPLTACRCLIFSEQSQLVREGEFFLLLLNVLAYRSLVGTDRRNEIASGPEVHPSVILTLPQVAPGNVDCALALDDPNNLSSGLLLWNRNSHVHMIGLQMPFHYLALFLSSQIVRHLHQMLAKLPVYNLASIFWNPIQVALAIPTRVAENLYITLGACSCGVNLSGSRLRSLQYFPDLSDSGNAPAESVTYLKEVIQLTLYPRPKLLARGATLEFTYGLNPQCLFLSL